MLKRLITNIIVLAVLLLNGAVNASSVLEKNITDVLESDSFLIQFTVVNRLTNIKNDDYEAWVQHDKDNKIVFMVAKMGSDRLTVIDQYRKNKLENSVGGLYKDGYSYNFMNGGKKCYGADGLIITKGMPISKMNNDGSLKTFERIFSSMFYSHMQSILPNQKENIMVNGSVVISNVCSEFVKDGRENIGGVTVDYIEYKTPGGSELESTARYYIQNGRFVKYIRFDKEKDFPIEEEWQKAYGTDKYGYGGYAILDVKQFTKDVNANLFQIPKGVKIHEVNMPTNFY